MKKVFAILTLGLILTIPFIGSTSATARDFDNNAVVRGGAFSKDELLTKINRSGELRRIFFSEKRGLSEAGIKKAVEGTVTKSGTVIVGGRTVATNVFSSGRSYMPGSTRDQSLWMRPPSVSFRSNSLSAFVVMEGGTFRGAVIKSCGNPVKVLVSPFPNVFKRVRNERTEVESDADTRERAITAQEGDKLTFTVTVTNRGTGSAESVFIKDTLPTGLNLKDPNKRDASMSLGTITASNKKFFQIKVTVAAGTAGQCFENIAFMTAKGGFTDRDSAFVCVVKKVIVKQEQVIKIIKFHDVNHDGVKGAGEEVLPGFTFQLDNGETKITDSNGLVVFSNVTVGQHTIREINIPSGWIAISQNPFTINIAANQIVILGFGNQKVVAPNVIRPQIPVKEVEVAIEQPREKGFPAELPQAGPGAVAGSILGLMSLGYAGTNYARSRKRLRNVLKK